MPGQAIQCDCCMYFRFDEFDEAIDEAIEDDIKEADGGGTCLSFSFLHLAWPVC